MSNVPPNPPENSVGMDVDDDITMPSDVPAQQAAPDVVEEPVAPDTTEVAPSDTAVPEATPDSVTAEAETQVGLPEDETAAEAEQPELIAVYTRTGVNPFAELTNDPSTPLNPKRAWRDGEALFVIPCTSSEFNNLLSNAQRLDPSGSERGRTWAAAVSMGREVMPAAAVGLDALTRESLWRQSVPAGEAGSVEIKAGRPKFGEGRGDGALVGEEALQRMQAMLGTGQIVRLPLWHSGIWISLKAPTESQLLELDRRIATEKIRLGRDTSGLAYSNMSVYHNSYLANFALQMVFDCSISGYNVEMLKDRILLPDLPQLLWGLLCTIYPNGYRYFRPCINDPSVCQHVVEELLDISKLSWTDNMALTQSQRAHMVRKTAKIPDGELKTYTDQHRFQNKGTLLVKDFEGNKTVVELRVPTLADYEASGFAWVDGIVAATDAAFGSQLNPEERDSYLLEQAAATSLRQYAHWIKRIVFNGKDHIEDRATLDAMISQLTGDVEVYSNFLEGVKDYINEATISQIAIPTYKCPSCQKDQINPEESKHPHLIPLDIGTIFFILLGQRTLLLLNMATP